MEKRSEVKNQPVWHSKQGEFVRCVEEKAETLDAAASKGGFTREKTLDLILNLEMVKEKTAEEIKQIWKQYYSAKDTFYAVIPAKKFDLIWKRAQSCPSFLCALPRREGYEFFMGQWVGTELHYTALINVQVSNLFIYLLYYISTPPLLHT
uniref:ATP synthase mitochondrial F1 complex assembly factor 1 n=1 Tax=Sphenodon punctatus TaxID=8508 RepID=A0A8D0GVP0_SPHPU